MSKLLPCPFCGGEARFDNDHPIFENRMFIGCTECNAEVEPLDKLKYSKNDQITLWNTRPAPARCDELVTVGHLWEYAEYYRDDRGWYGYVKVITEENPAHHVSPIEKVRNHDELVTRQNAEEVIAAERAEKEKLEAAWLEAEGIISDLKADNASLIHDLNRIKDHETKLINDNVAKDARIKELEEHFDEMTRSCLAERDRNKALEADNKRLREALENLVERFSYYADLARDGVPNIEDWAYTEGSSDIAKARAALGEVKP